MGERRSREWLCPRLLRRRSEVPVGGHRQQVGTGPGKAAPEGYLEVRAVLEELGVAWSMLGSCWSCRVAQTM